MASDVQGWSVGQVAEFLRSLELSHLAQAFIDNAVNGKDLLELSDDDFINDLKCTSIQVGTKKI